MINEGQAEFERRAGPARGDKEAILQDPLAGLCAGKLPRHGKVRGEAFARQQPGIMQDKGSGANGRHGFACGNKVAGQGRRPLILAQHGHRRATGNEKKIEVFGRHVVE